MKLTFKKEKGSTGLAAIGEASVTSIKFKKKVFGRIHGPSWCSKDSLWRITICNKDSKKTSLFRYATLTRKGSDEAECRVIAQEVIPKLVSSGVELVFDNEVD